MSDERKQGGRAWAGQGLGDKVASSYPFTLGQGGKGLPGGRRCIGKKGGGQREAKAPG